MILEEKIVSGYVSGKSVRGLSKELSLDRKAVKRILAKRSIPIRGSRTYDKYTTNHTFFDVIDTEAKAYFLGLLFMDGCVSKKNNGIFLGLKEEDGYLLDILKSYIYTGPLFLRPAKVNVIEGRKINSSAIRILAFASEHMKKTLVSYGCTPAKSLNLEKAPFDRIPEALWHHFLRGVFCGNGTIYKTTLKNPVGYVCYGLNFYSTLSFLKSISEVLPVVGKFYPRPKIHSLSFASQGKISEIVEYLYKDATIFLRRKKGVVDEFRQHWLTKTSRKATPIDE